MYKSFICLFSFVLLLWQSGPIEATDYYVSPSGSDSNPGTSPGQAWKTIGKVNGTTFGAGDSIFFEGGQSFSGSLYFDTSDGGTPGNPLAISSYGSGRATISSGNDDGLFAYNCGGIVVKDLIFTGSGYTNDNGIGIFFWSDLSGASRPEHIYIDNVEASEYKEAGIGVYGDGGLYGFKDVRITNAEVHDNADVGIVVGSWPPPASGWAYQNVYVGDCTVYNNRGIAGKGSHSGNGILVYNTVGGLVEYCEAYNNGELCDHTGGGPVGIWAFDSNEVTIQFSESHDNDSVYKDGGGFDLDGGVVNCVMQYNYSHDNRGPGYMICQYDGAREMTDSICRFNISQDDGYGLAVFTGSSDISGITFYNNTAYNSNTSAVAIGAWGSGSLGDPKFYNNIIFSVPDQIVGLWGTDVDDATFQGNVYWDVSGGFSVAGYASLAAWRSATSQEILDGNDVGFECDPCLVNPGGGGTIGDPCNLTSLTAYKLQSNSPLINGGLDLQAEFGIDPGAIDYYGTSLPRCYQFDVGAHEYYFSLADFDCDEVVDFIDYTKLASAWKSSSGEPDFNDHYDLYDDDTIDIPDLGIFSDEWLWGFGP